MATGARRNSYGTLRRWAWLLPSLSDLAFILPILLLFWCTTGVGWLLSDSDTGWHIRTGEWILRNGRVPRADIFSFTKAGDPWFAWEWLTDVVMAIFHDLGGLAGIVLLSILTLGAAAVCVYRNIAVESGHRLLALNLTALAMSSSTIHWLARPHLVTPLMAAVFCGVINRVEREGNNRILFVLPLLTALWVNSHGGFFVGIILLGTYAVGGAAEELLQGVKQNAWIRAHYYLYAAGACALASLANPYGYHLHLHIARYLGVSFYFQHVSEFQSVDFHSFASAYFETLLLLAIAAVAWHLASGNIVHGLLLLSWSHLALLSARNIPIFAVIAGPGIGVAMREWLDLGSSRRPLLPVARFSRNLAELEARLESLAMIQKGKRWHLVPCFGVCLFALLLARPGHITSLRAEFSRDRFPCDAATFLSRECKRRPVRVYADWQWGGYLIYRLWPAFVVFADGRTDFYGPSFVQAGLRVWNVSPDWRRVLEQYHVNAALLPVDSALAGVLLERSDWKLAYQDDVAALFEKVDQ